MTAEWAWGGADSGCPVCGLPVPAGARFCQHCGAPQAPPAATAPPGPTAVSGQRTERRVVTVLFGDLSDFTAWAEDLDPERVGLVLDRVLAACATAVTDHGGHVDKLTGDGIMAVFGAPTAHEDDATRAVRAAAAMQDAVRGLVAREQWAGASAGFPDGRQLGLRVGLNTGAVLAGVQARLSYTVVGDTVNTASRISDAAAVGAVLAGRDTASATMQTASWRALAPLRLKGKREPVPAYELVGLRDGPGALSLLSGPGVGEEVPLVGRDAELGRLIARLVDVSERERPATELVTGDAGIGKTRLVRELGRFTRELPGGRVLWGRCAPYGVGRDLAPLVELVRGALGLSGPDVERPPGEQGSDGEAARVRRLLAHLEQQGTPARLAPPMGERLLGLLGLVEEDPNGQAMPAAVPPGREQPRHLADADAVAALLRTLTTRGPLVVCVDDLQWAGPSLREALGAVGRQLDGPALLVLAGREGELLAGRGDTAGLPDPEVLALGPLDEDAAEQLLRSFLGDRDGPGGPGGPGGGGVGGLADGVREQLLGRAQGNPFFLGELLHLLVDRGVLRPDESGRWALSGALPDDVLPAGVRAVLAARIDSLEPAVTMVLADAAVLGARVTLGGLVALAGGEAERGSVRAAVAELLARRLMVETEEPDPAAIDGLRTLAFSHSLLRDVAYASVPKADRAHRHALAARWAMGAQPAGSEVDETVATHADRAVVLAAEMGLAADDPAWSVRELGAAAYSRLGAAAAAREDHATAARLLARALALSGTAAEAQVRVSLAGELARQRRLEEAYEVLAPVLREDDPVQRAPALVVLGDVLRKQGDDVAARQAWVSAFALASEAGLDRVASEAIRHLGLQDYFAGRLRAAEQRFAEALDLAGRTGDLRGTGWALQHSAWAATTRGAYDEADATLADAAGVFAALQDIGGLSWVAGTEGLLRVLQGRHTEARELVAGLLPAAAELGDRWAEAACLTIDALAAAELGSLTESLAASGRAAAVFEDANDPWATVLALSAQGAALRGAGRRPEALAVLEQAVQLAGDGRAPMTGTLANVVLGLTRLEDGDVDGAAACVTSATALLTGIDLEPGADAGVQVLTAQVARARGDRATALTVLQGIADMEGRQTLLFPRRQALAHLSGVLLELGRLDEGLDAARRAVAVPAEDVRSRIVALRALGNAYAARGEPVDARAALQEALAVLRSTEQVSERDATLRALAAVG